MTVPLQISIGDATIGGLHGLNTGLLVGSIFYDKHSIVSDAFAGEFDADRAGALLDRKTALAKEYGVQMAVDVIAASEEAMEIFIPFVAERTPLPILINATEPDARVAGLRKAAEIGILDRCIFASLNEDTEDHELDALKEFRPAAVMVLALDISDISPEGTIAAIKERYRPMLDEIGQDVPIIDVGAMDPPSIGISIRSIEAVISEFGYPAGCAFSNCFPQWTGLRSLGREWVHLSLGTSLVAVRAAGGTFLHYGLIESARVAAHAAGTAEVFYGFAAQDLDAATLPSPNPLQRMFKLGT